MGGGADPEMPLAHLVEVSALTVDEPARAPPEATWTWAGGRLDEQEVRALAEAWRRRSRPWSVMQSGRVPAGTRRPTSHW